MITLEPLAIYILERASGAHWNAELHPNILSANFELDATAVRQMLVRLDSGGFVELSKWDDQEHTGLRLRDFDNPNAFFESGCDAGYVRVSLRRKGRETLDARNAAAQAEEFTRASASA